MSAAYQIQATKSAISQAQDVFERACGTLRSAAALSWSHGAAEQFVVEQSREIARLMLQELLDLRRAAEKPVVVRGSDGVTRTERREGRRKLESLVGGVTVSRLLYQAYGVDALAPLDASLALTEDSFSSGVRRRIVDEAVCGSYDHAVLQVSRTTGAAVAKRQAERLVRSAAVDFCAFYAAQPVQPEDPSLLLVLSFDGAGIVMRPESLRSATKRAAEKAKATSVEKWPSKVGSGEKPNRKRMAQVAAVYGIGPFVRAPEDILKDLRSLRAVDEQRESPVRPRPVNKRVWASVERDAIDVIDEAFDEALRRDPEQHRTWLVLVDGSETQIALVRKAADRVGVRVRIIVDLIHVIEYLWAAAYAFHEAGTAEAQAWVTERVNMLLSGVDPSDVAAGMRRSATRQGIEKRRAVDTCATYLLKNRLFIRYGEAISHGWPIATGVIEGACRHLVRARLDGSGARWSVEGAEAILVLRSVHLSGDMDAYWAFHLARELDRNHRSRYANGNVPSPVPCARLRVVK